jgi:hypothetical protein
MIANPVRWWQGCPEILQNFSTSAGDLGQGSLPEMNTALSSEQQSLAECFATASQGFGGLTGIIIKAAQKFIDRNG